MRSHAEPERLSFKGGMSWRKAAMFVFLFTFLASLSAGAYLDFRYARLNPKRPQPETGRVRRYSAHMATCVYVSEREENVVRGLFASSLVSFLALICLGVRWKFTTVAGGTAEPPVVLKRENE